MILGRDGSGCRSSILLWDLDLTFDLAILTLAYKILSRPYLRSHKKQEVDTWWDIGCCVTSDCDLDLTFDITIVTLTFKFYIREYVRCTYLPEQRYCLVLSVCNVMV